MCSVDECKIYVDAISVRVRQQRQAIWGLALLLGIGVFVGVALLLIAIFLGDDLMGQPWTDVVKIGAGLLIPSISVPSVKEIFDRRTGLAHFEFVREALDRCATLTPVELDTYMYLAKEIAKKL